MRWQRLQYTHLSWYLFGSPFPLSRLGKSRRTRGSEDRDPPCFTRCSQSVPLSYPSSWRQDSPDSLSTVTVSFTSTTNPESAYLHPSLIPNPPQKKLAVGSTALLCPPAVPGADWPPTAPLCQASYTSPQLDLDLLYGVDHLRYSHLVQFRCAFPATRQDGSNLPLDQWQRHRSRPPEDLGRHILILCPVHNHHPNAQSR
jgi:hypothetical protein